MVKISKRMNNFSNKAILVYMRKKIIITTIAIISITAAIAAKIIHLPQTPIV